MQLAHFGARPQFTPVLPLARCRILLTAALLSLLVLAQTGQAAIVPAVPTDGLVAYYPFTDSAADISGSGNNGTAVNVISVADRYGVNDHAFRFTGTNSYVAYPETVFGPTTPGFSWSMWVQPDQGPASGLTVINHGAYNGEASITWSGTSYDFAIKFAYSQWKSSSAPHGSGLVHLVAVYEKGKRAELWIDGQLGCSFVPPNEDLFVLYGYPNYSSIGTYRDIYGVHPCFKGNIDDVRIYNRALTTDEVQQVFSAEAISPTPGYIITTGSVTELTSASATLNGTVASTTIDSGTANASFQYGMTADYGFSSVPQLIVDSGSAVVVSAPLSGLAQGTTYHYRLNVVTSTGTTSGPDQSFTTLASAPAPDEVVAFPQTVKIMMGTQVPIQLSGSSTGNNILAFSILTQPAHGTLLPSWIIGILNGPGQPAYPGFALLSDGQQNWIYYPDAGFVGNDSFTFQVSAGSSVSSPATVDIRVTSSVPEQLEFESTNASMDGSGAAVTGEPDGTTFAKLGVPSIRDGERRAFSAVLKTPNSFVKALITGPEGRVFVRQGDPAPDASGNQIKAPNHGLTFSSFSDPIINNAGQTAFLGTLAGSGVADGNKTGLWTDAFGQLSLVARIGSPAPGAPTVRLAEIDSVVLADGTGGKGMLAFTGKVDNGRKQVTKYNDRVLWGVKGGIASVLLREGSFVMVDYQPMQLKRFVALGIVQGSPGQGRSARENAVLAQAYFTNGTEAVLLLAPGKQAEVVAVSGETLAGAPEGTFVNTFGVPTITGSGHIGGRVALLNLGGVREANTGAILLGGTAGDYSQLLVSEQDTDTSGAAGIGPVNPFKFTHLSDPVINSQGYAAFTSLMSGGSGSPKIKTGLWWGKPGSLHLVAMEGDSAPGTEGRFASFVSLALPDGADDGTSVGPVFLARLIGEPNSLGLWAVNSLGQLQLVALKGSQITVNGTEKIISEIDILSAVPGTPAQARSFNREQKLIYRLTFRGGDQKIVTELIP